MRTRRTSRTIALAALTFVAAMGVTPSAGAHGVPSRPAGPNSFQCGAGYFCVYSGWDGGGSRCQYRSDTANTADNCAFIRAGKNVLSVWNGNHDKATYYKQTNYRGRVGSTPSGRGGNLMGSYQIRSIKF